MAINKKYCRFLKVQLICLCTISCMNIGLLVSVYAKDNSVDVGKKFESLQLYKNQEKELKIKNAHKKVKWRVLKKKIVRIKKKYGKGFKFVRIKALKVGTTRIIARCGTKKYVFKVKVKKRNNKPDKNKKFKSVEKSVSEEITTNIESEKRGNNGDITIIESESKNDGSTSSDVETTIFSEQETMLDSIKDNTLVKNTLDIEADVQNGELLLGEEVQIRLKNNENEPIKYQEMTGILEEYYRWNIPSYVQKAVTDSNGETIEKILRENDTVLLKIPISSMFKEVKAGDYRYTFKAGNGTITVEFTIKDKVQITGKVEKDTISKSEELVVYYTISGKGPNEMTTAEMEPGILEKFVGGEWIVIEKEDRTISDVSTQILGSQTFERRIDLTYYYKNVSAGHYRYTYNVGTNKIAVEFNIIE